MFLSLFHEVQPNKFSKFHNFHLEMLLRRTRGKPKNDFTSVQWLMKYMQGSDFFGKHLVV